MAQPAKFSRKKLSKCLRCGYSLRGLPKSHACPECGLRFDGESFIWRARHGKWVFVSLLGFIAFVQLPVRVALGWRGSSLTAKAAGALGIVAVLAFIYWQFRRVLWLYRKGQYIAITPGALVIGVQGILPEFIPWSNIGRATVSRERIGVVIFLKKEKTVRGLFEVFRDKPDAEAFVECARKRICPTPDKPEASPESTESGDG